MVVEARPFAVPPSTDQILNTEGEIIRSYPVVEAALKRTLPDEAIGTHAIIRTAGLLQIRAISESSILVIEFKHSDPQYAANLLNNLVDAYNEMRGEIDNRAYIAALFKQQQERLNQQIDSLTTLKTTMLDEQGISKIDQTMTSLTLRILELEDKSFDLRARQLDLEGERLFLQNQLEAFQNDDLTVPYIPADWKDAQVISDQFLTTLSNLRSLQTQYAVTYVEVIRLQRQSDKLKEMLIDVFNTHIGRMGEDLSDIEEQLALHQTEIAKNKRTLEPLPFLKNNWDNVSLTLQNLNGLYSELTKQRLAEEINTPPTGNISISLITPAIAPPSPTYPRRLTNIFLGFIGSLAFTFAIVYLLDVVDRTVKYGEDLESNQIPYLAGFTSTK